MANGTTNSLLDGWSDDELIEDFPWLQKIFGRRKKAQAVGGKEGGRTKAEKIATEFSTNPFYDTEVAEGMVTKSRKK